MANQDYGRAILGFGIPLLIAAATYVILIMEFQPGLLQLLHRGDEVSSWSYAGVTEGENPFYRLEIRPAQDEPSPGWTQMKSERVDHPVYVSNEVLFTNADIAETWVQGPHAAAGYLIGLKFNKSAVPRLEQLSAEHVGRHWAILLNEELFVAPEIVEPLRNRVVLQGGFNQTAASNYARGMVRK